MNKQPAEALERARIRRDPGRLALAPDLETALSMAILHTARLASHGGTPGTVPDSGVA